MITITASVTVTCVTMAEFDQAKDHVARQNLTDAPVIDEARRVITFNVVQIVEAL